MVLEPGTRLGGYEILALIGAGGAGEVYRALDTRLQRPVALKLLSDDLADATARRRFQREAQLASALNHPHIVAVHDAGERDGRQYLVTEYIDGGTLRAWTAAAHHPWPQVVELLIGVADALAAAHEAGIIHRDVKPENILVTRSGYAKIADFGLAKLHETAPASEGAATITKTRAGSIVGTVAYMSPEQALGQPLDVRSDVFSFGVVLYELLAGRRPFAGATDLEVLKSVIGGALQPIPDSVPPPLGSIVRKALEHDAAHRYQTMQELVVDLRRLVRPGDDGTPRIAPRRPARSTWAAAGVLIAMAAVAMMIWQPLRAPAPPASADEWVPLTHFPDSVGQPSLSADGRMLAFVRGSGSFSTLGQIYVKMLPDGEPKQLTRDDREKMSPVFSPDGSRIAYTTRDQHNHWDTWEVPVLGGEPRQWLPNASGLAWVGPGRVLFSEIFDRVEGNHMKIVAADESRAAERDVYVPQPRGAMAHRSFPSPDGTRVLVAEMTDRGDWLPCRLVPVDASSSGQPVGPTGAPCWFAAWSPDGRWIYTSSQAGATFHLWRQRYGSTLQPPEQITKGPTSEEGIAMAPDGRSLVTAVGSTQRSVWIHDGRGDRQISVEGYASQPQFGPDGKTLFYLSAKDDANELWAVDVQSGRAEPLLPHVRIGSSVRSHSYDISNDGRQVAYYAPDGDGKRAIWIASTDRRTPPRRIAGVEGDGPVFGPDGDVFFRAREGTYGFAYRVRPDGTGLRKALEHAVIQTISVSPDGQWLAVYARPDEAQTGVTLAFPLNGGPAVHVPGNRVRWSKDGSLLFVSVGVEAYSGVAGRTYVIPLARGQSWPKTPAGGFQFEADLARVPGARVIDSPDAAPGPTADVYAFSREAVQRNLYRIPLR